MQERLLFGFVPIYGVLITLAIGLGIFLCLRWEKPMGLPREISIDFALAAVPAAVVGARLYYVAFEWPRYAAEPLRILRIWEGGLAIYGAVIGGAAAALIFSRVRRLPFGALADLAAPALILGQAIGRWGNFVNQEAFGSVMENPALQFFPLAVYVEGTWHMATFFYESVWDFLGFLLLWRMRNRTTARGNLFFLYLAWYGLGRAVIEGLRMDSLLWGGIRVSQVLSVILCILSVAVLILRHRKHRGEKPYPLQSGNAV